MNIYLVRHTTPDIDRGVCYGQSDIGVAASFRDEVKHLKISLSGTSERTVVYTSPARRCSVLASKLFGGNEVQEDNRLQELNFGDWELRNWQDIDQQKLSSWMKDFVETPCPGGESYLMLYDRVMTFWKEMLAKEHHEVTIVTHGGVIRCLLSHVIDIPLKNSFKINISFGSVSAVSVTDHFSTVQYINR